MDKIYWYDKKIQMKTILLSLTLLLTQGGHIQALKPFEHSSNPQLIAATDLERMKVKDISRRLSEREKHDLCRLFVKAYANSIRKHRQDYALSTSAPIYRLLATNFPGISAREGEGGSIIFLGAITGFFNASPEYRRDVVQVLKEGISTNYCRQP